MRHLSTSAADGSARLVKRRTSLGGVLATAVGLSLCLGGAFYWHPFWFIRKSIRAWLRLAGVRSEYVQLGSFRIHFLVGGRGRPLVLVHGLGGRAENWATLIPSLMRHGHRIFALDLLGFGQSERPGVDYSIRLQVKILRQFIDSQQLQHADLGGWSMGGWVSLKFALEYPHLVRRIFLVDSAGINFDFPDGPGLFQPESVEQVQHLMRLLTPQAHRIPRFVARDMISEMRPTRPVVQRLMESMMTRADLLDGKLCNIRVPVLLLWGKQDGLIPVACGQEMHRQLPHSVLTIFDGCGHLAPAESAARLLPEILHFLEAEPPLPSAVREFPRVAP
jgi:pimeloyl-ACP methyl ester carboxylesterase